ncbi:hypothetical protein EJB05_22159, partial [Eragrostis curvula]
MLPPLQPPQKPLPATSSILLRASPSPRRVLPALKAPPFGAFPPVIEGPAAEDRLSDRLLCFLGRSLFPLRVAAFSTLIYPRLFHRALTWALMEHLEEIKFSWPPVEEEPDLLWAPMEQLELSWAPEEETDQGLHGLLADQQLRRASAATIGLQMKDYSACDDDATMILHLLKEPQDEGDLDEWLSGVYSSPSQETDVNQTESPRSSPGGTRNFPSKKRGTRKKRMSPWNPLFFEQRRRSASLNRVCASRKNNSRWTQEEVELLVKGISEYGIGKWTEMKAKYFSLSIRTSVNLKDKWRNLLKAYDVKLTSKKQKKVQKTTLLHLDKPLIKRIRVLAEKHRRAEPVLSDSSSSSSSSKTSIDSFLTL